MLYQIDWWLCASLTMPGKCRLSWSVWSVYFTQSLSSLHDCLTWRYTTLLAIVQYWWSDWFSHNHVPSGGHGFDAMRWHFSGGQPFSTGQFFVFLVLLLFKKLKIILSAFCKCKTLFITSSFVIFQRSSWTEGFTTVRT